MTDFSLNESILKGAFLAVDRQAKRVNYKMYFMGLRQLYFFKFPFQKTLEKCYFQDVKKFCQECYRMITCKVINDYLLQKLQWETVEAHKQKCQHLIKLTQIYSTQISPKLGIQYCNLLRSVKADKSASIEFILFLVFLASEKIVYQMVCSEQIHKIISDKSFVKDINLPQISCIIINYEITKIKVNQLVYKELYRKFIKNIKVQKQKTEYSLQQSIQIKKSMMSSKSLKDGESRRIRRALKCSKKLIPQLSPETQNLKKELEAIWHSNEKKLPKVNKNQKQDAIKESENQQIESHLNFNLLKDQPIKLMSKNVSEVFEKNCLNADKKSKNFKSQRVSAEKRRHIRKSSDEKKMGKKNVKVFSQLALLFLKQSKSELRDEKNEKTANWKQILKEMSFKENFQVVQFGKGSLKRKNRNTHNEGVENMQFKDYRDQRFKRIKENKNKNCEQQREVFFENIIKRQLRQMGVVRSIVNFTNYGPQQRKQKLTLKQLKNEQRQFNKGILEDEFDNFDRTFNERLQKALTGKRVI